MLEFVSRKYAPAWLLLATFYEELGLPDSIEKAKEAIRHFLEASFQDIRLREKAWSRLADLCKKSNESLGEAHALVEMCLLKEISFEKISESANRLNELFSQERASDGEAKIDWDTKEELVQKLVKVMRSRIEEEGGATDCSRLAWLYKHLHSEEETRFCTELGLSKDPQNQYCLNLKRRHLK